MLGCGVGRKLVGGEEVVEGGGGEMGNEFLVGGGVGDDVADHGGLACARFSAGEAGGGGGGGGCKEHKEQDEVGWERRHH